MDCYTAPIQQQLDQMYIKNVHPVKFCPYFRLFLREGSTRDNILKVLQQLEGHWKIYSRTYYFGVKLGLYGDNGK